MIGSTIRRDAEDLATLITKREKSLNLGRFTERAISGICNRREAIVVNCWLGIS